ncbi:MAG: glutathione peroxidase [Daejeonella sp.]|uniref:glutathione peroxidase n=1 Tax=Daejeonella sp. TaxID=2805397 RepID=UPI002733BAB9|nr:glutathione peroxidase [Daejeonella sp.]MDP3470153.1 glutathione peroxidase [Daejeonella sp.]
MNKKSVYQFSVQKLNGEHMNLDIYGGKVLLLVNIASECGFTPQLKELESLRKDYQGEDFEILAFPSNDFGGQEPLEGFALGDFCEKNYGVSFPVFEKIRVRGEYAHPLYKFLSDKKLNGNVGASPRWNFHKYLINTKGEPVDFFYPFTKPNSSRIKKRINKLLITEKL